MNIKKVLLKKPLIAALCVAALAATTISVTVAGTFCAPAPDIAYPSTDHAIVYDDTGLYTAINNTAVSTITFGNDITVTRTDMAINSNRANPNLVFDGAGYTLTEYFVPCYDYCKAIHVDTKGTLNSITLENMNINGENAYGTISVSDCVSGLTMSYNNITYTGPQLTYDSNGPVIYDNCNIHIAYAQNGTQKGTTLQEVAEAKTVELKDNVTILKDNDTDGCADEIFWLKTCNGAITVDPGANVNVTYNIHGQCTPGGFVYAGCNYTFTVGTGASFTYNGCREFWEGCGVMSDLSVADNATFNVSLTRDNVCCGYECRPIVQVCGNVTVGNNATFKITTDGDICEPALQVSGNVTTNPGAVFRLVQQNDAYCCPCGATLYMTGCCNASTITFNQPSNLLIYNGNDASTCCCARAIGGCCNFKLNFIGAKISYWYNAASSGGPDVLKNPAITWNNSSLSTFTVNAGVNGCCTASINALTTQNYTGATALTQNSFSLVGVRIVSVGSQTNQTVDLNGTVNWGDSLNRNHTRPGSVTVTLLQNGAAIASTTVTGLSTAAAWSFAFTDLPLTDGTGAAYTYTVSETGVSSPYTTSVDGTTITNAIP